MENNRLADLKRALCRTRESSTRSKIFKELIEDRTETRLNLTFYDISGVHVEDVSGEEYINLESATLIEASFLRSVFSNINLCKAQAAKTSFTNCYFDKLHCAGAQLYQSRFSYVRAAYGCFERAQLYDATISHSSFQGVDFKGATLIQAHCDLSNFYGADFSGARVRGASFVGSNLSDTNLDGVSFEECDLSYATLIGAQGKFTISDSTKIEGALIVLPLPEMKETPPPTLITENPPREGWLRRLQKNLAKNVSKDAIAHIIARH